MSATEKLRRMLDERGVEWADNPLMSVNGMERGTIFDSSDGRWVRVNEALDGTLCASHLTPEQAIAVTVGETCCIRGGECDQCGAYIHKQATTYWVPTGEGLRTVECHDVHYCPNCGRRVVE